MSSSTRGKSIGIYASAFKENCYVVITILISPDSCRFSCHTADTVIWNHLSINKVDIYAIPDQSHFFVEVIYHRLDKLRDSVGVPALSCLAVSIAAIIPNTLPVQLIAASSYFCRNCTRIELFSSLKGQLGIKSCFFWFQCLFSIEPFSSFVTLINFVSPSW